MNRVPAKQRFYRPELDVLRFLAFLLVFFRHGYEAFASPGVRRVGEASGIGLPVFFLLSAYLITELLLREQEKTGTIHLRAFFVRRILRIWPLYFLFLLGSFLIAVSGHGVFPPKALAAFLLLWGN